MSCHHPVLMPVAADFYSRRVELVCVACGWVESDDLLDQDEVAEESGVRGDGGRKRSSLRPGGQACPVD